AGARRPLSGEGACAPCPCGRGVFRPSRAGRFQGFLARGRYAMATATWVRDELGSRGIAYEERHHPEAYTAQEVAQREHVSGHRVAKVVCIMADGQPIELILPASRRVQLDWVRKLLGAQAVRLATEDELCQYFTDCEPGAIPA